MDPEIWATEHFVTSLKLPSKDDLTKRESYNSRKKLQNFVTVLRRLDEHRSRGGREEFRDKALVNATPGSGTSTVEVQQVRKMKAVEDLYNKYKEDET
jgi:hypothetical protein